jgi:site-specific recombinase XerD
MAGVSLFVIQKLLGHANPAQTMVNAKLSPHHLGAEVARLHHPAPRAAGGCHADRGRSVEA